MDSPAPSRDTFTHEPLPDPAKYIRLLEVLDDKHSKAIKVRCRLTTWHINSAPPYHAISYTWGDAESNTTVLMNDQALQVRTNCEFALKQAYWYRKSHFYLYRKWRPRWYEQSKASLYNKSRYFWLDAICIDQTNLGEKSKQVAMMGSIYKEASHVLACIGDHADDSLFFFQTLYGLSHYVVRPRDMIRCERFEGQGVSFRFRLLHRYATTHRFVLALARLAVRPYFTRMWILQELQHAPHITILCGKYVLPKDDALYLFSGLQKDLEGLDPNPQALSMRSLRHWWFIHHRFWRRHFWHGFPHPVWYGDWIYKLSKQCMTTLVMLRQNYVTVKDNVFQLLKEVVFRLQCQDPRDKVYGIISLIDWGDVPPVEPDYTHNDVEVAVRFVESIMKLGEARDIGEPIWKYVILTIKLLSLNTESPGLSEVLEARRGPPGDCAEGAAITPARGSIWLQMQRSYRLSQEDIDKNACKLQGLQVTPPKFPDDDVFFLPRWARENDWVIEIDTKQAHDLWYDLFDAHHQMMPHYTPLLVMREGAGRGCDALIGYGFYSSLRRFATPWFERYHASIDVCFDIEDAIIFLWRMKQLYEIDLESRDWMLPFLETFVSRQQTPESSYAVVPKLPAWTFKRVKPEYTHGMYLPTLPSQFLRSQFVLFDTKTRRGWLVNGHVVALQLLRAYLRNTPQTEPFDFSKLNHIDDTNPKALYRGLTDDQTRDIPIFRVLNDVGKAPELGEPSEGGETIVEEERVGDVLENIFRVLLTIQLKPFPKKLEHHLFGIVESIDRLRNTVVKGWDFERIYRTHSAKIHTHVFEDMPNWFGFVEDVPAAIIFGSDFGEIIQPDGHCCPYFTKLPEGQDYLAAAMYTVQYFIDYRTGTRASPDKMAKLTYHYGWEHGIHPFVHLHGQGEDHLERVDSSCFPVYRARFTQQHTQQRSLIYKSNPRLFSSQDVEDMNVAGDEDSSGPVDSSISFPQPDDRPPKAGMIVFGKQPDEDKLRKLAQAKR